MSGRGVGAQLVPRVRLRGDNGSLLPLLLLAILIVLVLAMAVTASTSAFIAQRELQSDCDSAASAAASGADPNRILGGNSENVGLLPMSPEAVQVQVDAYRERFFADDRSLTIVASVHDDTVVLRCSRRVTLPFGAFFGKGGGIDRTVDSAVRSPLTGAGR